MTRRFLITAAIGVVALGIAAGHLPNAFAPAGILAENIRGMRPSYGPARVAEVPNEKAIAQRFWVPGLDDGYNPQGLDTADGAVLVSAYRSDASNVNRGPCRVFRLDPESGRETGHLDVPAPCGHAGGLAHAGDDTLYVADTHALFGTLLTQAFSGRALPFRGIALGPGLTGALAVSTAEAIWLGTYKENGPGRLYRFGAGDLARLANGAPLTVSDASAQLAIPSYAQGAAIDRDGRLWVARSEGRWGELDRLDLATGTVERRYAAPPGIEGIAFDSKGRLCAVSEAGARHVYDHFFARRVSPFFPLVFEMDPGLLK
jgi:sugar lactone lactonase YvrE